MTSQFITLFWDHRSKAMMCHEREPFKSLKETAQSIWDGHECDQVIEIDLEAGTSRDASKEIAQTLYDWWNDAPRWSKSDTAADFINEHTIYGVAA